MIELCRHKGTAKAGRDPGKEIETQQFRIVVDGRALGFIPDTDGATALIHAYLPPKELQRIDEGVRALMHPKTTKPTKQLPPPPVMHPPANGDDF